jgi:hypothetical protein
MSTVGNGTTSAGGTDPVSGYNLELSHLLIMFFLFLYRLSTYTTNPYDAIMLLIFTYSMICFMIFGIKICHKMPKSHFNLIVFRPLENLHDLGVAEVKMVAGIRIMLQGCQDPSTRVCSPARASISSIRPTASTAIPGTDQSPASTYAASKERISPFFVKITSF